MKRTSIIERLCLIMTLVLVFANSFNANAQSEQKAVSENLPLHLEARLGVCAPSQSMMPTDITFSALYQITPRFSAHIITTGQYFVPKEGVTSKYNHAFGLGGGIGFAPLPIDPSDIGVYEIRANMTAPVGSSNYKNMGYGLGIYWRGNVNGAHRRLVPLVGVEYRVHDFKNEGLKTFMGFYATFGLRF